MGCQICDFEDLEPPFGILKEHFGGLGAHRDILEGNLGSRVRFCRFLDDSGLLLGPTLGSFSNIFSILGIKIAAWFKGSPFE